MNLMYIMHNSNFLPEILDVTIYHGHIIVDHFTLVFEFTQ